MENVRNYEDLVNEAIEMIEDDDDLYVDLVDELDSYMGYADGFRCYSMDELDEVYCDCKASKIIEDLTEDFCINDDYFYFSIYGLESCDDKAELYRDHTTAEEIFDEVLNYSGKIYISDSDFEELLEQIENYDEDEEFEEDEDEETE